MLCRHLCNASSKRRCTACGILTFSNPGDQCRRWRTSASDPNTYGSSDDPLLKGRLDNLTIGLCGDLKFGRTVHSLISALVRYTGIRFVLISPEELRIPSYIRDDVLRENNIEFEEVERLEDALPKLDVLYMTRVQKERFFNEEDYVRMKDFYILDKKKMELAPQDMIVMHPLPRVNEIAVEVDDDPRAAYFKQAQYAVYARMALILTLLEVKVC